MSDTTEPVEPQAEPPPPAPDPQPEPEPQPQAEPQAEPPPEPEPQPAAASAPDAGAAPPPPDAGEGGAPDAAPTADEPAGRSEADPAAIVPPEAAALPTAEVNASYPEPAVSGAGDAEHEWTLQTFGIDPRTYAGAPEPDRPEPETTGPDATGPADAGAGGAGGAPQGGDPNGGAEGSNAGSGADAEEAARQAALQQERVDVAAKLLHGKSDDDIAEMDWQTKEALIRELTANNEPTGAGRRSLERLYEQMPVDPRVTEHDRAVSEIVANRLAGDPDLEQARATWPGMTPEQKQAVLEKVARVQSEEMGAPTPIIVQKDLGEAGADGVGGKYADGRIDMNQKLDFDGAIAALVHENTHNYQATLVQRLADGTLTPADPEYAQARLFAANQAGGYIKPLNAGDAEDYVAQPVERHAYDNGRHTSKLILARLAGASPPQ